MPESINLGDIISQPLIPLLSDEDEIPQDARAVMETSLNRESIVIPPQIVEEDSISITIKDDDLPDAILKAVLLGLSEEQQALKNLRAKKDLENKDTSSISFKRGSLLKYMSETLIQRQALVGGSGDIDLKGPKFREIFKMILTMVSETFEEVKIPPEFRDLFFQALSRNMVGWEVKAEKILKNVR